MSEKTLVGSVIIGQSGGPSSVINCSAYGVIKTALENENITKVYGAFHGIKGVLNDQLMIMDEEDPAELARFAKTLNARARNTIKAAQSAQIALDAATGQERMEGWWK